MMYFIEFSQFSMEDDAVTDALRKQMGCGKRNAAHWTEWTTEGLNASPRPDVTLINVACLDWRQLKLVVDASTADAIVLTGRQDSMLSLPVLPHITALDDLLPFMSGQSSRSALPPLSRGIRSSERRFAVWADTTPLAAWAAL
jgi:hypothetical protein